MDFHKNLIFLSVLRTKNTTMRGFDSHPFHSREERELNMAVPNELEKALKEAYSYESRAGHEAEEYETWYIGNREINGRIYELYKDSNGGYWYKVRYRLPNGQIVTEEEAVFSHKLQDKNKRGKKDASSIHMQPIRDTR